MTAIILIRTPHTAMKKCGSQNIQYATRIIGYLKKISSWGIERQKEHSKRSYQTGINL